MGGTETLAETRADGEVAPIADSESRLEHRTAL